MAGSVAKARSRMAVSRSSSDDAGLRFHVTARRNHQQSVQLFSLLSSQSTGQQREGVLQGPFARRGKEIAQGRTARAHDPLLLQPAPGSWRKASERGNA
jgi:hypothetical protein